MFRTILFLILLVFTSIGTSYSAEKDTFLLRIDRIKSPKEQVKQLNRAGEECWKTGNFKKGIIYCKKGLKIAQKNNFKKEQASLRNNIGIIYDYLGSYPLSLENYFEALKIQEKLKDSSGIAYTLSNIGLIYSNQGNNDIALRYHHRSLFIRKSIHFKPGEAASYNNIGICHLNQKKYEKALFYFNRSKEMDIELKDSIGLMDDLNNIGICYMKTNQTKRALEIFNQAADLRLYFNDQFGLSKAYSNIATCYSIEKKWKPAEEYFLKALEISKEIKGKENLWYSYANLSDVYAGMHNYKKAFEFAKLGQEVKDKLTSESSVREETETELKYEFDKKQLKKDIQENERRRQSQILLWSIVSILFLIVVFLLMLFRRWKLAIEQKKIIELQRAEVQLKNTEIVDSINYALRIQNAILPSKETLTELFTNHGLVYQPKDIVAGDFYWTHSKGDTIYFAVADCTGHGVPGAFMSLLCNNALNRAILEFDSLEPGNILSSARSIIVTEFAKSQMTMNDGMDITLCAWNKKTNECSWAGANNPLWIKYPNKEEMVEIKGDKQPVGNHHSVSNFTTHQIALEKGARIFLFTDGIPDQFGEKTGKKFKSKQLKELLLSTTSLPIEKQAQSVLETVNNWKGSLEQIDDICMLIVEI